MLKVKVSSQKWATLGVKADRLHRHRPTCEPVGVHGARMTWRFGKHLCLIVFLSLIEPSKENCKDYFTEDEWENSTELRMVSLVMTQNKADVGECTLKSYCSSKQKMCNVLDDCFPNHDAPSKKCKPVGNVTVHTHHLMCLVAKAVDSHKTVNGCEYASVCPFFMENRHAGTAMPTTMAPQTRATSPVWSSHTAPLPASHEGSPEFNYSGRNETHAQTVACQSNDVILLTVVSAISSTLAIVLPFAVYFYMRPQKTQERSWQEGLSRDLKLRPLNWEEVSQIASADSDVLMENVGISAS